MIHTFFAARCYHEVGIGKGSVAESVAEGIERCCLAVDIVVRGSLAVEYGYLTHIARYAHRYAACGIVVAKHHIGHCLTALFAGIPCREQCVGALRCHIHIERTTFDIHYHQFHAGIDECAHQFLLVAEQIEACAVVAFA